MYFEGIDIHFGRWPQPEKYLFFKSGSDWIYESEIVLLNNMDN